MTIHVGRRGWLPGVLIAGAVSFLAWQNHVLAERVDMLARAVPRTGDAPALPAPSLASCYLSPMFARQLATELRGTLASAASAESAPAPRAAEPAAPVSTEAADSANRTLDEVLQRGRITPDDLHKLGAELVAATSEQRDQLRARIAAAINRNELVPEDPHALYP